MGSWIIKLEPSLRQNAYGAVVGGGVVLLATYASGVVVGVVFRIVMPLWAWLWLWLRFWLSLLSLIVSESNMLVVPLS